jgi:hypothetical protein
MTKEELKEDQKKNQEIDFLKIHIASLEKEIEIEKKAKENQLAEVKAKLEKKEKDFEESKKQQQEQLETQLKDEQSMDT